MKQTQEDYLCAKFPKNIEFALRVSEIFKRFDQPTGASYGDLCFRFCLCCGIVMHPNADWIDYGPSPGQSMNLCHPCNMRYFSLLDENEKLAATIRKAILKRYEDYYKPDKTKQWQLVRAISDFQ